MSSCQCLCASSSLCSAASRCPWKTPVFAVVAAEQYELGRLSVSESRTITRPTVCNAPRTPVQRAQQQLAATNVGRGRSLWTSAHNMDITSLLVRCSCGVFDALSDVWCTSHDVAVAPGIESSDLKALAPGPPCRRSSGLVRGLQHSAPSVVAPSSGSEPSQQPGSHLSPTGPTSDSRARSRPLQRSGIHGRFCTSIDLNLSSPPSHRFPTRPPCLRSYLPRTLRRGRTPPRR